MYTKDYVDTKFSKITLLLPTHSIPEPATSHDFPPSLPLPPPLMRCLPVVCRLSAVSGHVRSFHSSLCQRFYIYIYIYIYTVFGYSTQKLYIHIYIQFLGTLPTSGQHIFQTLWQVLAILLDIILSVLVKMKIFLLNNYAHLNIRRCSLPAFMNNCISVIND